MNSGFALDLNVYVLSVKTRFQTLFESAGALPVESTWALPIGAFACSTKAAPTRLVASVACCERG